MVLLACVCVRAKVREKMCAFVGVCVRERESERKSQRRSGGRKDPPRCCACTLFELLVRERESKSKREREREKERKRKRERKRERECVCVREKE